jgi:hypothetical protein
VLEPEDVEAGFIAGGAGYDNTRTQARPGTVTANLTAEVVETAEV